MSSEPAPTTSATTPTPAVRLDDYRESYDAGDLEEVTVRIDAEAGLTIVARGAGRDELHLEKITPADGARTWTRETFRALRRAVDELHERGFDVDLGALGGLGMQQSVTLDDGQAAREQTAREATADGGAVTVPEPRSLAEDLTPAVRMRKPGRTVGEDFRDREWDADDPEDLREAYETTPSIAEAARKFDGTSYSTIRQRLIEYGIHDPRPPAKQDDRPEWLDADPEELLEMLPNECDTTIDELCEYVERFQTLTTVHRHLPWDDWSLTQRLFGALGLSGTDGKFYGDARERCAVLREVADE